MPDERIEKAKPAFWTWRDKSKPNNPIFMIDYCGEEMFSTNTEKGAKFRCDALNWKATTIKSPTPPSTTAGKRPKRPLWIDAIRDETYPYIRKLEAYCDSLQSPPAPEEAVKALGMLYDKWENGDPCYEDPEEQNGYLGTAFKLSEAENNQVLSVLEKANPGSTALSYLKATQLRSLPTPTDGGSK